MVSQRVLAGRAMKCVQVERLEMVISVMNIEDRISDIELEIEYT